MSPTIPELVFPENPPLSGRLPQRTVTANGNEAAVIAAQQFRADACPIRLSRPRVPTGELAERAFQILSDGQAFVALMEAAEEFSRRQEEVQRDKMEGPAVWNVPVHDAVGELDIDSRFRFLQEDPDKGAVLLLAFCPQEVYDLNLVGSRLARLIGRPVVVLSDGQTTDRERRPVQVISSVCAIWTILERPTLSPVSGDGSPDALGFSPIDHLVVRRKWRSDEIIHLFDHLLAEFGTLTGRRHRSVEYPVGKAGVGKSAWVVLNPPSDALTEMTTGLRSDSNRSVALVLPRLLRPFPAEDLRALISRARSVVMVERGIPPRLARSLAEEVRMATGFAESGPAVVVRSFGDLETVGDAPAPGDTDWAYLEALRFSATPHHV